MTAYVLRRVAIFLPMLWVAVTLIFVVFRLIPGDPAALIAGPSAPQVVIDNIRHQLGFDRPIYVQYLRYLWGLVHGDLGTSTVYGSHVREQLLPRFPVTLQLATGAVLLALVVGIGAGIIAAIKQYSWVDHLSMLLAVGGVAIPSFWLGLLLIALFSVRLHWVPISSAAGPRSAVLPIIALAMYPMAVIARLTRSGMLEVLRHDYVRTARAKGLSEHWVIYRHALRNALIPVVTAAGLQFGYLLGGSIVIESVFARPGIGLLMMDSIRSRDYTMVQAVSLLFGLTFLVVNLAVDLAYAFLDPQVRYG